MLSNYLNQGAALRHAFGTDDRGQTVFGLPQAVKCRKERRGRIAATAQGATRLQETVYYLTSPVFEGDMLDGMIVKSVDDWVGLRGEAVGYKAVV